MYRILPKVILILLVTLMVTAFSIALPEPLYAADSAPSTEDIDTPKNYPTFAFTRVVRANCNPKEMNSCNGIPLEQFKLKIETDWDDYRDINGTGYNGPFPTDSKEIQIFHCDWVGVVRVCVDRVNSYACAYVPSPIKFQADKFGKNCFPAPPPKMNLEPPKWDDRFISAACTNPMATASKFKPLSIFGRMMQCVEETMFNIFMPILKTENRPVAEGAAAPMDSFFTRLQNNFKKIILALISLYIVFIGFRIVIMQRMPERSQLMWDVLKIGLVLYFALGSGMSDYFPFLFDSSKQLSLQLLNASSGVETALKTASSDAINAELEVPANREVTWKIPEGEQVYVSKTAYPYCDYTGYEYPDTFSGRGMAFWDTLDCRLRTFLGAGSLSPGQAEMVISNFENDNLDETIEALGLDQESVKQKLENIGIPATQITNNIEAFRQQLDNLLVQLEGLRIDASSLRSKLAAANVDIEALRGEIELVLLALEAKNTDTSQIRAALAERNAQKLLAGFDSVLQHIEQLRIDTSFLRNSSAKRDINLSFKLDEQLRQQGLTQFPKLFLIIIAGFAGIFISGPGGLVISILAIISVYFILLLLVRLFHVYMIAFIALIILAYIAPLTIPLIFFSKTRDIFDNWLKQIVAYTLQPIILFGFLGLLLAITDHVFYADNHVFDKNNQIVLAHIKEKPKFESPYDFGEFSNEIIDYKCYDESSVACFYRTINFANTGFLGKFGLYAYSFGGGSFGDIAGYQIALIVGLLKMLLIFFIAAQMMANVEKMSVTMTNAVAGGAAALSSTPQPSPIAAAKAGASGAGKAGGVAMKAYQALRNPTDTVSKGLEGLKKKIGG